MPPHDAPAPNTCPSADAHHRGETRHSDGWRFMLHYLSIFFATQRLICLTLDVILHAIYLLRRKWPMSELLILPIASIVQQAEWVRKPCLVSGGPWQGACILDPFSSQVINFLSIFVVLVSIITATGLDCTGTLHYFTGRICRTQRSLYEACSKMSIERL